MAAPAPKLQPVTPASVVPGQPYVPETGKIAVQQADGSVWKIPQEDWEAAQREGATLATEADYVSEKMGKPIAQVSAGAIGVARGASLGFSDTALIEGSRFLNGDAEADDTRHALNLAKEAHPNATFGGEVAGMALPMFFGGGAGGAGAVARATAGAEGVLGRVGASALRAAPRAALEGAAIGAGQQASEDALGNHKYAAENYLAAGFKGGAMGVILGAGIGAGAQHTADRGAEFMAGARHLLGQFGRRGEGVVQEAAQLAEADAVKLIGSQELNKARAVGNLDAGLEGGLPRTESPFFFGQKTNSVRLDSAKLEQEFASVAGADSPLRVGVGEHLRVSADPDQGIIGSFARAREEVPNIFAPGKLGRGAIDRGEEEAAVLFRPRGSGLDASEEVAFRAAPRMEGFADEGASALANREAAGSPYRISGRKDGARTVLLDDVGGEIESKAPFRFGRDPELVRAESKVAREAEAAVAEPEGFFSRLKRGDTEHAYRATGAKMGDVQRLGRDATEQRAAVERINTTLNSEVPLGALESQESYGARIAERANRRGAELGAEYQKLNKAAARPSIEDIANRFDSEIRKPGMSGLEGPEQLAHAEKVLERLQEKGTPSFSKLHEMRVEVDGMLRSHYARARGMPAPPGEKALIGLRGLIQEELELAGERASTELGSNIIQNIRVKNAIYKDLAAAASAARKESARGFGNAKYSLSDMIAMTAAIATGSPLGAVVPIANYVRKNFGNQIASYALDKASRFTAVQTAANTIDEALQKGSRAFLEGTSTRGTRASKTLTAEEVRRIRDVVSNPAAVEKNVTAALGDLPRYAPATAGAFTTAATRTAMMLAQMLPKERPPIGPMFTGRAQRPMSDTELRQATALVEVAADPTIVLDRIRQARLTRDHVKALKIAHPETYTKMRNYLTEHAAELRPTMSIQQQVSLSILFQTAIAEVMQPKNIRALQASFVGGSQAPKSAGAALGPTVPQMGAGPVKGGGTRSTFFDSYEKGGRN